MQQLMINKLGSLKGQVYFKRDKSGVIAAAVECSVGDEILAGDRKRAHQIGYFTRRSGPHIHLVEAVYGLIEEFADGK